MEGSRQAAEYVLAVFARVPENRGTGAGLDLKLAKGLDTLSRKLSIPVADLKKRLAKLRQPNRQRPNRHSVSNGSRGKHPREPDRPHAMAAPPRQAADPPPPTSIRSTVNSSRSC